MAGPPIKAKLESPELTSNIKDAVVRKRLADCLASDPMHIQKGAHGDHVKVIQDALNDLRQRFPDLSLLKITDPAGTYGQSTADAVEKYKAINAIIRPGQKLDNIVGRMTITQLDNDLLHGKKPQPPEPIVINAPTEIATVNDNLAKDDLTFRPAPPGTLSGKQLMLIIDMRRKTTPELEELMLSELRKGDLKFGPMLANNFFKNSIPPSAEFTITQGADSEFSNFVASTAVWRAHSLDFRLKLDKEIKRLGVNGPFEPKLLKDLVPAPVPSWSPQGMVNALGAGVAIIGGLFTEQSRMLVLVGSFQGSRVFLHEFAMNPTNRRYTGTLFYQLIDHFGVDTSDIVFDGRGHGSEGQVAFWVLQHERHKDGHMPYRSTVVIREFLDGSF